MAQNTILEFIYISSSIQGSDEQEFLQTSFLRTRFHKNLEEHPSSIGSATALLQGKRGYSSFRRGILTRFALKDFFPTSCLTQKRRKIQYQQATYKKSIKICRQVFCPTIRSIQGKRRIFMRRATYKGNIPCVLSQEFPFFWFTSIGVQKQPVLVKVSAPTRLGLQGSHVRRQYRKQTTLHSKSSTIKGLLYARLRSR